MIYDRSTNVFFAKVQLHPSAYGCSDNHGEDGEVMMCKNKSGACQRRSKPARKPAGVGDKRGQPIPGGPVGNRSSGQTNNSTVPKQVQHSKQ